MNTSLIAVVDRSIGSDTVQTVNARDLCLRKIGHVYVIESSDGQSVKVGRSANPKMRVFSLRHQANANGRVWISPLQSNCVQLESIAHKKMEASRQLGEWFSVGFDYAVEVVNSICTQPPTQEEVDMARNQQNHVSSENKKKLIDLFADRKSVGCSGIGKIITQLFLVNLIGGPEFEPSEKFSGASEIEFLCSVAALDEDIESIACLIHEACEGSKDLDSFSAFMESVRDRVFEKAKAFATDINNEAEAA